MKIGIKHRLFLAFLLATCTLVGCMFLIMQLSFERGFLRYINSLERVRLEQLADRLRTVYDDHGSWDFLRGNSSLWFRLLAETRPEEGAPMALQEKTPSDFQPSRRMLRRAPHLFESRILLLDADGEVVIGSRHRRAKEAPQPLMAGGRPIGYLSLRPPEHLATPLQQRFAEKQRRSFGLIALVMAAASALLSIPLAQRLVRRITMLAAATHRLTDGHYETRVQDPARDELGQLARDFNSLAQTLEKNRQLRRQWVADISHELRTPLAVLRGEIEALQDGVRCPTPQSLAMLHDETMHLNRLVDDLYQLSLADINALSYRKERMDLGETLRQAIEPFRGEYAKRGIALQEDLPATPPVFVEGDQRRLHQLFANLLENSLRYTDDGGTVQIHLSVDPDGNRIFFEDTAPGVPPDKLDYLFDRLYRVEGSRSRSTGGAGLGLTLCKTIVEAHDGTITARPSALGGLQIAIFLPREGDTP